MKHKILDLSIMDTVSCNLDEIIFFPTNIHTVKGNLSFILEIRALRLGMPRDSSVVMKL